MAGDTKREEILNLFCSRYEGREVEIGCIPLVYGDLVLIAEETNTSLVDVAVVLQSELEKAE